jgi:hypothetical protein
VSGVHVAPDPSLLVLHALRLRGVGDPEGMAPATGLDAAEVAAELAGLARAGLVVYRDGRLPGWSLTPAGLERHRAEVAAEVARYGCRPALVEAYRRFLDVNGDLLAVCTDWQVRDGVPNDHADAAHDEKVVARLRAVDEAVQPVCADLAACLPRYGCYGPRLARALARVERGERDWFTRPMMDSYHTVWFELHEDLLVTLGIERGKEGEPR